MEPSPSSKGVIERTEATLLAREKLSEVMTSGSWRNGPSSGDFGPAWAAYTWTMEIVKLNSSPLCEVRITVFWESQDRRNSVLVSAIPGQKKK
jgi:hypothetical protein